MGGGTRRGDSGESRVRVTAPDVGFLLGKGGRTKEKLARVSGCQIEIREKQNVVEVYGSAQNRRRAEKYPERNL